MNKQGFHISEILLDENKKVKTITGWEEHHGKSILDCDTHKIMDLGAFLNKEYHVDNMRFTDTSILMSVENYRYDTIKYDFYGNLKDITNYCNIVEIHYENISYTNVITKIGIRCMYLDVRQELIKAGAVLEFSKYSKKYLLYLDEQTLMRLYKASKSISSLLEDIDITLAKRKYQLEISSDSINKLKRGREVLVLEGVFYRNQLKKWLTKASILGIIDDYNISETFSTLYEYSGKHKCPALPPVREIGENAFRRNGYVEKLFIPDTVSFIATNLRDLENLKHIELGKGVVSSAPRAFYNLTNITELNLKNMMEMNGFVRSKNLNKVIMNIGCIVKPIDGYINPFSLTDVQEIEIRL